MFRQEDMSRSMKAQFPHDAPGKKDHMQGTHCSVRHDQAEPPPRRAAPAWALRAARGVETQLVKARKVAESARTRNVTSHLYTPGQGWGQ